MKILKTNLLINLIESDFFLFNQKNSNNTKLSSLNHFILSLKQFVYILRKPAIPSVYIITNNKQQNIILSHLLSSYYSKLKLISIREALVIKQSSIFIAITPRSLSASYKKIYQNSNSLIFILNNKQPNFLNESYKIIIDFNNLKQIIFLVALIKKIFNP